jgi:hypothetical protein
MAASSTTSATSDARLQQALAVCSHVTGCVWGSTLQAHLGCHGPAATRVCIRMCSS